MRKIYKNTTLLKKKTVKKLPEQQADIITVILLCDSPGYRMKSYGPISLIDIYGSKLIDTQIKAIRGAFSNYEIIVCLGFDSEKVCKHIRSKYTTNNIRVVENQLYNSSNSCEGLRLSLNNTLNNKILICDGNLLLNQKCLKLIDLNQSCALFEKTPCENLEIGFNKDERNIIQHFSYGATTTWSEICFLNGRPIIDSLKKVINSYDTKTRFIFEAINELIRDQHNIHCIENNNKIIKINNIKTYHAIKDAIL